MAEAAAHHDVMHGRTRVPQPQGLRRVRLLEQLVGPRTPRLSLVVAPAGCGKTTLLAHVAECAAPRVAWLSLDADLASVPAFLAHLQQSFAGFAALATPPWTSATEAVDALDGSLTGPTVLLLDEVQTIADAPSLEVVKLLLRHQPDRLSIVFGARTLPQLGISRHRLSTTVSDIGADDLRFRTWEVDELFRSYHDARLRTDEVAVLAQRTGGWAAGLQLFHLATAGRPRSARSGMLTGGLPGGRLTGRYLAEQVLEQLNSGLLDFVLCTSVLSRLSAERCDAIRDAGDSMARLAELERLGLLAVRTDRINEFDTNPSEYCYHEVLHTHLLDQLEARRGGEQTRALHRRAAELWLAESMHAEAVRSFCRAQDWTGVRQTIDTGGQDLAGNPGAWLDLLPASIHHTDPWIGLALARRLLAEGSLERSLGTYERTVSNFGGLGGGDTAERELRSLRAWRDPPLGTIENDFHQLRLATIDPAQVAPPNPNSTVIRWCAHAFARLVAGELIEAASEFESAVLHPGLTGTTEALAMIGRAVALTIAGHPQADDARRLAGRSAEAGALPVLERLADGLVRVASGPLRSGPPITGGKPDGGADSPAAVADLLARCRSVEDHWGAAVLLLFVAVQGISRRSSTPETGDAVARMFTDLHAPALTTWAGVISAVAAAQHRRPLRRETLTSLERAAAAIGPLPQALALVALGHSATDPAARRRSFDSAARLAERCAAGRWIDQVRRTLPTTGASATGPAPAPHPDSDRRLPAASPCTTDSGRVRVTVLGEFNLSVDAKPVDTKDLRPLHQQILRMFSAYSDRVVPRDRILDWFWPGNTRQRAQHSLQVAVSELRRLLEPGAPRGGPTILCRVGNGYRLQLHDDDDCDARRLEHLVRLAVTASRRNDDAVAITLLDAAVDTYRGELLPDDGAAEWAMSERQRLREVVVGAYERLVVLHAAAGQHVAAVAAARKGLTHNRHCDSLWRQLVCSLVELGEPMAAATARRGYDEVLEELGVSTPTALLLPLRGSAQHGLPQSVELDRHGDMSGFQIGNDRMNK